ncbi:MAG: hypothetical protein ACYS1C_01800 [Planctomycetota bacterium]|jgi:hypothetical protein
MESYEHRQFCPLTVVVLAVGLAAGVAAATLIASADPLGSATAVLVAWAAFAFGLCLACVFLYLRVRDGGEALLAEFGPLPLFRIAVPYENIESVERTTVGSLRTWQVYRGRPARVYAARRGEAVGINLKRPPELRLPRAVIVGTDDADALLAFLRRRIGQAH